MMVARSRQRTWGKRCEYVELRRFSVTINFDICGSLETTPSFEKYGFEASETVLHLLHSIAACHQGRSGPIHQTTTFERLTG